MCSNDYLSNKKCWERKLSGGKFGIEVKMVVVDELGSELPLPVEYFFS